MPYGVANPSETLPAQTVERMLDRAWEAGITAFDTAPGYGEAEERLGRWIKRRGIVPHVATKLPSLAGVPSAGLAKAVDDAIRGSTDRLGLPPASYLTHGAADYLRPAVRDQLHAAAARGAIGAAGLSVYTGADVFAALAAGPPDAIQIPLSVFDQRMQIDGALAACAAVGVTVFARSVFLQGALLMAPDRLPAGFEGLSAPLAALEALCRKANTTRASIALRYVRDLRGITSTVIGAYEPDHLGVQIAAANEPPLTEDQRAALAEIAKTVPPQLLDPRNWASGK